MRRLGQKVRDCALDLEVDVKRTIGQRAYIVGCVECSLKVMNQFDSMDARLNNDFMSRKIHLGLFRRPGRSCT